MNPPRTPGAPRFPITVAGAPLHPAGSDPRCEFTDIDGERFIVLPDVDALAPFLLTVTSASDHWMFVSSTGALTAGRRSPDHALFPYTTDDRVHDSGEHTGGKTLVRVELATATALWEPLSLRHAGLYRTSRRLARNIPGNKLRFEEQNDDLGLLFACTWMPSDRFGIVRRVSLTNLAADPRAIDLVDGFCNLLPAGLTRRFQSEYSTLADAYKETELLLDAPGATPLALVRLASLPSDAALPSEALRATTVFSVGHDTPLVLLAADQLARFRAGQPLTPERRVRGKRGAVFAASSRTLAPGETRHFYTVANLEQDAAAVVRIRRALRGDVAAAIEADVAAGTEALVAIVAAADGLGSSADEREVARHFANVTFNCMRGGIPADGTDVTREDFTRFVGETNRRVAERRSEFLAALPEVLSHRDLLAGARAVGDPDLERIAHEYLPLTFSRRHGDPSRPWNAFDIEVEDADGNRRYGYQGNWRDIFQNWEALALSFPSYALSMIFKFLDASTADGHNPYRVTRAGFEWEVADPDDAWSHIGYWGDHQVIYLLRLLELTERHYPGRLTTLLGRRLFTYADVPYRIKPWDELARDPQHSIVFSEEAHRRGLERAAAIGAEGKTLGGEGGQPVRANLAEKLLVLLLARLANFIPGAGLWLSTQRPEWNDAQNALVGNGASVVTLAYLRRFLAFVRRLLAESGVARCEVAGEIAHAFRRVRDALAAHDPRAASNPTARRTLLESLARAVSEYRTAIYARGFVAPTSGLPAAEVIELVDRALAHVDETLAANRRDDGLYHAYNLVSIGEAAIEIRRLPLMLEGQVAVLSAGILKLDDALDLLDALERSPLYRPDQQSYLLYPDRTLPGFLEKNTIPPEAMPHALADTRLIVRDDDGGLHFASHLGNARVLAAELDQLGLPPDDRRAILALYETVFEHQAFTGRAGSFYKYEGLGCVYWHMASKLLVAVTELADPAQLARQTPAARTRLRAHHDRIRAGLGLHKSPAAYGALPTDPYSHTPGHAGVQQPGLTGQVKEDIVARARRLGVLVDRGQLAFDPFFLGPGELHGKATTFQYLDVTGQRRSVPVPADAVAFTLCQVPVIVQRCDGDGLIVHRTDGASWQSERLALDASLSQALFDRRNEIRLIEVLLEA